VKGRENEKEYLSIFLPKMISALNWVHEAFEEGPIKHRMGD